MYCYTFFCADVNISMICAFSLKYFQWYNDAMNTTSGGFGLWSRVEHFVVQRNENLLVHPLQQQCSPFLHKMLHYGKCCAPFVKFKTEVWGVRNLPSWIYLFMMYLLVLGEKGACTPRAHDLDPSLNTTTCFFQFTMAIDFMLSFLFSFLELYGKHIIGDDHCCKIKVYIHISIYIYMIINEMSNINWNFKTYREPVPG